MKAAIYARVSTGDQNCEMQLRDLRAMAEHRGFEIASEYIDNGVSGSKASRPELDRMLKDARKHRFSILLVWRLDRLGRSLVNLITLLEQLQGCGVCLASYSENLDFSTPTGRLMFQLVSAFAEFERASIVERVKAGIANARAKGVRLGRPSNRVTAEQIAAKLAEGKNHAAVAAELGISRSSVFGILQRNRAAM